MVVITNRQIKTFIAPCILFLLAASSSLLNTIQLIFVDYKVEVLDVRLSKLSLKFKYENNRRRSVVFISMILLLLSTQFGYLVALFLKVLHCLVCIHFILGLQPLLILEFFTFPS